VSPALREATTSREGKGPSPSTEPASMLPSKGYLIAGKYRLDRLLACGGMGAVWIARHIELDIDFAIKLMAPRYVGSPRERARFVREARAAARLRSKHIVGVLDYGVDGSLPYIVMELLEGEDLWTRLEREGALSLPAAAAVLTSVARGLELAHAAGILHRDLKPCNIFLARGRGQAEEEVVKILDFGVAKDLGAALDQEGTESGVVVGTPHYMSPEQTVGMKSIDGRTDLWSLAVVLFRAITGRMPFEGTTFVEVADNILKKEPAVASRVAPHLSADVDRFFERALARDRGQRFQTAGEMVQAFQRLLPAPPRAGDVKCTQPLCGVFELSSDDRGAAAMPPGRALWRRLASWWLVSLGLIATLSVIALALTGPP
jgi:serine/threonine-protein kinase